MDELDYSYCHIDEYVDDDFSEVALEDFSMIQQKLSYCTCQSIGMALAKLKLLEEQGCKVEGE